MSTTDDKPWWERFDNKKLNEDLAKGREEREKQSPEEKIGWNLSWLMTQFRSYPTTRQRCGEIKDKLQTEYGLSLKEVFPYSEQSHPFGLEYPCTFQMEGLTFFSAEHALHHRKAVFFANEALASRILDARTPSEWRQLSREIEGFYSPGMDDGWVDWLTLVNQAKFLDPGLKKELLSTSPQLLRSTEGVDHFAQPSLNDHYPADPETQADWYDFVYGQNATGWVLTLLREQWLTTL